MGRRGLLVSDLDGTLLGDDPALEQFAAWYGAHRRRLSLAYASGRFFDSVRSSVRASALPEPDYVIEGVGSRIAEYPSGSAIWSPAETMDSRWSREAVHGAMRDVPALRPQPDEFQSPYKVSFYLEGADPQQMAEIERRLRAAVGPVDLIYSSDRDLDVLPHGVNKGSSAALLAHRLGVEDRDVIVAGDTGNDLSMFEHGYRGVVVANAEPVLRALRGKAVYHAEGRFAAGVLEGVKHWLARWD